MGSVCVETYGEMRAPATEQHDDESGIREALRKGSAWSRHVPEAFDKLKDNRAVLIGAAVVLVFLVLLAAFAVGRGSASAQDIDTAGGFFITEEQAEERRRQASELHQAHSELAIANGEAAYLRSQVTALTGDVQALQRTVDSARTEMGIIVAIYEECIRQLYPAECVEAALPRAEAFLEELYSIGR